MRERSADSAINRTGYERIRESWQNSVDLLERKKARSWDGIWAKATAIKILTDEDAIAAIAKSLAIDIIERASGTRESAQHFNPPAIKEPAVKPAGVSQLDKGAIYD